MVRESRLNFIRSNTIIAVIRLSMLHVRITNVISESNSLCTYIRICHKRTSYCFSHQIELFPIPSNPIYIPEVPTRDVSYCEKLDKQDPNLMWHVTPTWIQYWWTFIGNPDLTSNPQILQFKFETPINTRISQQINLKFNKKTNRSQPNSQGWRKNYIGKTRGYFSCDLSSNSSIFRTNTISLCSWLVSF